MSGISPHLEGPGLSDFLEALDGVVYLAATDGTILHTNRTGWCASARAGGAPELTPESTRGRSLFAAISGDEVRNVARLMHRAALTTHSESVVSYTFRCDAPDIERRMRMSLKAFHVGGEPQGVLYQSILLSENVRAPISLFEPTVMQAFFEQERMRPIVTMCSYCCAVAWPVGAPVKVRDWIEPTDYYRRGGSEDVRVSHGICPSCYRSVVTENLGLNRRPK